MPSPRLAAIMFTDIVDYTAMMQQNQQQAMEVIRLYESHLREKIALHKGELLQTYGDGSLSIFDSASAAVQCAKDIQEAIRDTVPLRIGIHLGEVTIDGEHTFGDGVNIASRIESMGVAGAVLVSHSIRQQIKNKPEFELESLGKFAFKNVAEPMTVYALANEGFVVPGPEQIKGKGELINETSPKASSQSILRYASIGFLSMVIGAILFWGLGNRNSGEGQLLDKYIREAKVAVGVFENFSGDENLDALGFMAAEWLSSGLRELNVRTVSPEMVRQSKDAIGILPNNSNNEASFAEITGAAYVVTGSYYTRGDSIILTTRLNSTTTGEVLKTFTELTGHKEKKEELVKEASQYLLGYWVVKQDQQLPIINPPKYEAYQEFLRCFTRDITCYQHALEIDPDFILARIWLMRSYGAYALDSLFLSEKNRLEDDRSKMTLFEQNLMSYASAEYEGDYQTAFDALNANYQLDSMDYKLAHQTASIASTYLNRTDIAIERFEWIFNHLPQFDRRIHNQTYYHLFDAYNREKQYDKTIDFYVGLPEELKNNFRPHTHFEVIMALLYQGRLKEAQEIVQRFGNNLEYNMRSAYMYAYIFPDSVHNPFLKELSGRIDELPSLPVGYGDIHTNMRYWNSRFLVYYMQMDWDRTQKELQKLDGYNWESYYQTFPYEREAWKRQEQLWLATAWACVYAQQGKIDSCYLKMQELEVIGKLYNDDTHMAYLRGATAYLKARIYAVLGEKEKAVKALKTSIDQGRLYMWWNIYFDLDFVNLKGYEPFEELIRPKG